MLSDRIRSMLRGAQTRATERYAVGGRERTQSPPKPVSLATHSPASAPWPINQDIGLLRPPVDHCALEQASPPSPPSRRKAST